MPACCPASCLCVGVAVGRAWCASCRRQCLLLCCSLCLVLGLHSSVVRNWRTYYCSHPPRQISFAPREKCVSLCLSLAFDILTICDMCPFLGIICKYVIRTFICLCLKIRLRKQFTGVCRCQARHRYGGESKELIRLCTFDQCWCKELLLYFILNNVMAIIRIISSCQKRREASSC